MDYALNDNARIQGVFDAVKSAFRYEGSRKLLQELTAVYDFRNTHVAHQEVELVKQGIATAALGRWIRLLHALHSGAGKSSGVSTRA